jgi:hypothetical protein
VSNRWTQAGNLAKRRLSPERFETSGVVFLFTRPLHSGNIEGSMFDRLPNRIELGIFAAMALVCAIVVTLIPKHDYAMMFASMPLFAISAVMGFRRSERLRAQETRVAEPDKELP